ncbi:MAG: helix-turn-helix transcriptional regulator [Sporolactobacillus sp.]
MKNSIKIRRKKLKLSQEELANLSKVTRQTILAIENNKYDPSLSLAFILAKKLNTTVDELFEFEEDGGDLNDF